MPFPDAYILYHARDRLIIRVAVSRAYIFRGRDAFLFRLVGVHRSASDIADTFDIRDASIELVIDHDTLARIDFNADVFEIEAFDIWPTTGGDKNNIGLELMSFRL